MPQYNTNVTVFSLDADGCSVGTIYNLDLCPPQELAMSRTFNALSIMSLYKYQEGTTSYLRNFSGKLHDMILKACKQSRTIVMSGSSRQSPASDLVNMEKRTPAKKLAAVSPSIFFELHSSSSRLRDSHPEETDDFSYDDTSLYDLLCTEEEQNIYRELRKEYGLNITMELKAAAKKTVDSFIKQHPEHANLQDMSLNKNDITDLIINLTDNEKDELSKIFFDNYKRQGINITKNKYLNKDLLSTKFKIDLIYFQIQKMAEAYPNSEIQFNFLDDFNNILEGLYDFFSTSPLLIPKNVTLNLYAYSDLSHNAPSIHRAPIQGTGEFNPNYAKKLKNMFEAQPNQYQNSVPVAETLRQEIAKPQAAPTTTNTQPSLSPNAGSAEAPSLTTSASNGTGFFPPVTTNANASSEATQNQSDDPKPPKQ